MKRVFLIILFAVFSVSLTMAEKKEGKIQFKVTSHDFGYIKQEKGNVSYDFEFENVGNGPLVIVSTKGACGCTIPTFSGKPVMPGEKGTVRITYLPIAPGAFNKTMVVKTDNKAVTLRVIGSVIPRPKRTR